MSSQKTPNLNMHKWVATDPVQRTEFNENFDKIDQHVNTITVKLADKAGEVETFQQLVPKKYNFGNQLANLKNALSNPLEQFVSIVFIGDSITWGMTATGNPTDKDTGRDGTLSDIRDNYTSKSWVNNFKRYIGSKYMFNASAVLSNWLASPSGQSIVEFTKEHIMFPYGGDFTLSNVAPVSASPIADSSLSAANKQMNLNVDSGTSGSHSIKFNFTGKEFTLLYASVPNSMKYEVFVDRISQGIFDTAVGVDGNVSGYNNQRTHTFGYVKNKEIEIKTVLGNYVGINTLKIDGIKFKKKVKIANQGIIGATTRSYLTNNLEGNTKGDGVAIANEDKYIFIQLGTNDRIITTGVAKGVNEYKKNLRTIIDTISQSDREIILMCANLAGNENPTTYSLNMQDVRNTTYAVAKEKTIDFIDNYSIFGDMPVASYTADYLHPNDYGHNVISRNIINAIEFSGIVPDIETRLEEHLNDIVSEVISTSSDISLEGLQVVSGFTKRPKRLDVYGILPTYKAMSIGNKSSNNETCIAVLNDGNTNSIPASLMLGSSSANYTKGVITINSDKSITINWTKIGTGGVGTSAIKVIAHY